MVNEGTPQKRLKMRRTGVGDRMQFLHSHCQKEGKCKKSRCKTVLITLLIKKSSDKTYFQLLFLNRLNFSPPQLKLPLLTELSILHILIPLENIIILLHPRLSHLRLTEILISQPLKDRITPHLPHPLQCLGRSCI